MVLLHHFRFPWIALAAFVGMVLTAQDATAHPASRDRARAMSQNGCCCVMHASGCCCETPEPISLASTPAPESGPQETVWAGVHPDSSTGRTCQCRSGGDPARVPSDSESRGGDEPRFGTAFAQSAAGPLSMASFAPPIRPAPAHARLPKTPLYLRTARLLI